MKIQSVQSFNQNKLQKTQPPSFKAAFVTVSEKNLGSVITKNVSEFNNGEFNKMFATARKSANEIIAKVNSIMPGKIKNAEDLATKTDLFVLAAGSGSRFKPLADAVALLRGKGEHFNKISLPFEIGEGQPALKMLDVALSINKFFANKSGYEIISSKVPTGSFGDVINHYSKPGVKVKDVIVACGDNVFDVKAENLLEFLVKTINNPNKKLGLIGVERTPEEVAKTFGISAIENINAGSDVMSIKGFKEKPELHVAKMLTMPNGKNIANTGMFVIKKEAMEILLAKLKENPMLIAKNDNEKYDFANAVEWIFNNVGTTQSDVKVVKNWEDVGQPDAYKRWLNSMKKGQYLQNFSEGYQKAIKKAVGSRITNDGIQFSVTPNSKDTIFTEGIKVKA